MSFERTDVFFFIIKNKDINDEIDISRYKSMKVIQKLRLL